MNLSLLHSALAQRVLAGPVLLFLLFLAPSCLLLRVCRSGILPRCGNNFPTPGSSWSPAATWWDRAGSLSPRWWTKRSPTTEPM